MANLRTNNLSGTGGRNAIDGALFFNGDGHGSNNNINALALADSNDWHFDGDFTIECWINRGKIATTSGAFLGQWESGGGTDRNVQLYLDTNGVVNGYMNRSTTNYQVGSVGSLRSGEWHHIALVLEGSTLRFYWNGKQTQTASVSGTQNNSTVKFWIGAEDNGSGFPAYAFNGYLSNVRVIKGVSLYKSGNYFTPPTEKLKEIDGTVLLCCQDSDDPTQEATGKTITPYGNISPIATERINQGTFGGGTYSPSWTKFGPDTVTVQNGGVKIVRSSGLTGLYQLLTTSTIPAGQYRLRGVVSDRTGPGNGIIRLSSASSGNGTIYVDVADNGVYDVPFTHSGSGNLYVNLMMGNASGNATFSNISFTNIVTKQTINLPPVGVDEGVVFDGDVKINSPNYMYFPTGDTSQKGRGRALIAGGTNGGGWGTKQNTISYIQIQSGGIAKDFGDLTDARSDMTSVSSPTRAVFGGGSEGASSADSVNTMEYVTIATTGNVTDFGILTDLRRPRGGVSNNTRGLFAGGYIAPTNKSEIDFITIASRGNATDYGDLSVSGTPNQGSSNSIRGVYMAGGWGAQIEYVTIASTGSGADFGDISNNRQNAAAASSSTRALLAGGGGSDPSITYIEFASLGGDTNFGDLTQGRRTQHGTSNGHRGIFCGGYTPDYNIIDYVDIATTGNAKDFGDLTTALREPDACSDSHGGLS